LQRCRIADEGTIAVRTNGCNSCRSSDMSIDVPLTDTCIPDFGPFMGENNTLHVQTNQKS
jgi:hypothetical protein